MAEKRAVPQEAALTHCEFCGADYERAADAPPPPAAPPAPAPVSGVEPSTHCEFCGAEYPLPDTPDSR